jgi:hypothetical protein
MKPPENANAPLAKGRRDKLTGGAGYATCPHAATRTEFLPKGSFHHAQARCAHCGRHLYWIARPQNVARRRLIGFKLAKLGMCPGLSEWECNFLKSIGAQNLLSPRQQAVFDRICAKYLTEAPE